MSKIDNEKLNRIREEIGNFPIYISVDESMDSKKRCVAHAIVAPLKPDEPSTPRLINVEHLPKADAENIVLFVERSLNILWPNGIHHNRVLLYVSDAAAYMKSSARILSRTYPKLIHCTCLAHGLHRVAEHVRELYADANDIIADTKLVFSKAPNRVEVFKEMFPNLNLPLSPIVTRWVTWIEAADYYHEHFDEVRQVLNELEDDAVVVRNGKRNFRRRRVQEDFAEIHEHYSCIPVFIKRLECRQISLRLSCMIVNNAVIEIIQNPQAVQSVKNKLQAVLDNNTGFSVHLKNINNCLIQNRFNVFPPNWNEDDARSMTFAPINSSEAERTFNFSKTMLRNNRLSFEFDNFAMHLISNVNVFED